MIHVTEFWGALAGGRAVRGRSAFEVVQDLQPQVAPVRGFLRHEDLGQPEDGGHLAQQMAVPAGAWADYDWQGDRIERHRKEIRAAYGSRGHRGGRRLTRYGSAE